MNIIDTNNDLKTLRTLSQDIYFDIDTVEDYCQILKETLTTTSGVGLALPQLGINKRMFIINISKSVVANNRLLLENITECDNKIYINPTVEIIGTSTNECLEGCLSVLDFTGVVERPTNILVTAFDETGKKFTENLQGYNARVFMHEYDHLDGVLFIDKVKQLHFKWDLSEILYKAREENDLQTLNKYGFRK